MNASVIIRHFPVLVAACLTVSCGTAVLPTSDRAATDLQGDGLAVADHLMKRAKRLDTDENMAAVYRLRAAEIAWGELDTDGGSISDVTALGESDKRALGILSAATEHVAANFIGTKYAPEKTYSHGGFSYRIKAEIAQKPGIYPLAGLESAKPAHEVKHRLCT
ncbi:MAG: hypothetical protein EOP85_21640, partial [Verrucomicrobiaceae bacterium]